MKNLLIVVVILVLIGVWLGINIGKDQPLFSNPLKERSVKEKLIDAGESILDKTGDALKDKLAD